MSNIPRVLACLFLLMLLTPAHAAFAKDGPDKITITGPGLATPIEITDPSVLSQFNPWDGRFLDANRTFAPDMPKPKALYEVLFFNRGSSGSLSMFYAFSYSPEPSGPRGRIYLPQEQDEWYVMDNETIARRSGWLYASAEWDTFAQHLLANQRPSTAAGIPLTRGAWGAALAAILVISGMVVWSWRQRRWRPA